LVRNFERCYKDFARKPQNMFEKFEKLGTVVAIHKKDQESSPRPVIYVNEDV
jgi:hypothetical protein